MSFAAVQMEAGAMMPKNPAEMSENEQYEEAMALNQKLKAMLAANSAGGGGQQRGYSTGGPARGGSNPRASSCGPRPAVGGPPPRTRPGESDYSQLALGASRGPTMESSHAINRRKRENQIAQENMGIAARIVAKAGNNARPARPRGQDQKLPPGWTRGIGGRLLPPPKQRWGQGPSFDAGDWVS